jgi:hypothetical protein
VHRIEFRQIIRDAEIAYAISPVVRRHRLSAEETEKFLLELRIPRAANVAGITDRLVCSKSLNWRWTIRFSNDPKSRHARIARPIIISSTRISEINQAELCQLKKFCLSSE